MSNARLICIPSSVPTSVIAGDDVDEEGRRF